MITIERSRRARPSRRRIGRPKAWRTAALLGASAALLGACGSGSNTTSPPSASPLSTPSAAAAAANVTHITLWESHNGGPVGAAMTALVHRFDAAHRSVQVSLSVTKASKKLVAAVAAGNAPVLAEISHYDGALVKGHALVPWNRFMKGASTVSKHNFFPAVWSNGTVGSQHYRLEADLKLSEVFYNESLFEKAGITSAPTTWSQLAADAAKLKAPGVIPLGWKDSSAHILPAFLSNGGTLLKGGNRVGKAVDFANPAGRQTFSYFHSLDKSGYLVFDHGTTLREDLASGHMAMIDGTSAGYQKVLNSVAGKFKVGAFVEPAGSSGHAANIAQGLGFVLPKGHTPAQDKAAWSFVQWWFADPQQAYWAEHTGYAPETKAGAAAIPTSFLTTHPGLAASLSAASSPYTLARPVSDAYKEVQAALDSTFQQVVTGKVTVDAGLAKLDSEGDGYMAGASEL